MKAHSDWQIGLPWVTKAEFLAGATWAGHDPSAFAPLINPYPIIHSSDEIVSRYAGLFASLKKRNALPGLNDVWLAATALALGCGIISRNAKHFGAVEGLIVWDYTQ